MERNNLIPMKLVIRKVASPDKPKEKAINGFFYMTTNHDGTTNQFIMTDLNKTKVSNNRIPFESGREIHFNDEQFIIDFIFIDPEENTFVARVSPLSAVA